MPGKVMLQTQKVLCVSNFSQHFVYQYECCIPIYVAIVVRKPSLKSFTKKKQLIKSQSGHAEKPFAGHLMWSAEEIFLILPDIVQQQRQVWSH